MRLNLRVQWLLIALFVLTVQSCQSTTKHKDNDYYPVTKVVDGDTFWIDDGTEKGKKIRLIGVDAPETRRSARKEVGYYGVESKKYLASLVLDKVVRLEYDVDRKDRYGRTLAYVYLEDGTFVNAALLRQGYAMVLTIPPNVRHAETFVKYQSEARKKRRGLWKK